jgi:hypothetical protein
LTKGFDDLPPLLRYKGFGLQILSPPSIRIFRMIGLAGWNGAIRMMEEKGRMGKNRDDGGEGKNGEDGV